MVMDIWEKQNIETKESEEARLEVYSRDDRLGSGWCMSLYVKNVEVMRFDLFEPAHEHWNIEALNAPRMFYPQLSWQDRINLATNNLVSHYEVASALCREEHVRGYEIENLKEMSDWAKEVLLSKDA